MNWTQVISKKAFKIEECLDILNCMRKFGNEI